MSRHGIAAGALAPMTRLLGERLGISEPVPGTLNVQLQEPYCVVPDAVIEPAEYNNHETLKLKRCRVRGLRCGLMRPDTHETAGNAGARVLEVISSVRLRDHFKLSDGDELTIEVDGDRAWWAAPESRVPV